MFCFVYNDFDRSNDISDIMAENEVSIEFVPTGYGDEVEGHAIAPTREQLLKFISEYEYFTCNQYPCEETLEEISEEIFEV